MKPFLQYHTLQYQKWLPSAEVEDAVVEEAEEAEVDKIEAVNNNNNNLEEVNIKVQNTLTCQLGTGQGAPCTSGGAGEHIFVQNQVPVHGRTFSPQRTNEGLTNSVK